MALDYSGYSINSDERNGGVNFEAVFHNGIVYCSFTWLVACCGIFFFSQGALAKMVTVQEQQLKGVSLVKSETKPVPELERAFIKEFGIKRGEDKVRYYYNRIDLNGDEVPETFVYLTGPIGRQRDGSSVSRNHLSGAVKPSILIV